MAPTTGRPFGQRGLKSKTGVSEAKRTNPRSFAEPSRVPIFHTMGEEDDEKEKIREKKTRKKKLEKKEGEKNIYRALYT